MIDMSQDTFPPPRADLLAKEQKREPRCHADDGLHLEPDETHLAVVEVGFGISGKAK
jgi:hypothetical protein